MLLRQLFPPPKHPQTQKSLQNKGPDDRTILTVNGRIRLSRRRYAASGVSSSYPLDSWLDRTEDSLTIGVREMVCRLNLASRNFDKAAETLGCAAQVYLSGEFLRQVVESEGRAVTVAAVDGKLPTLWHATDCKALDKELYFPRFSPVVMVDICSLSGQNLDRSRRWRCQTTNSPNGHSNAIFAQQDTTVPLVF